jgi:hypothetical protein
MKRILGAVLMLAGAACAYIFATRAMYFGRESISSAYDVLLPIHLVGLDYPTGALILMGALLGFVLGTWFVITGTDGDNSSLRGGRIARVMLLNALLLIATLAVAYIGAKSGKDGGTVAIFAIVAVLQAALGLILLILSLFERPKGIASLIFGAAIYLGGVGIGVFAFFKGA